MSINPSEIIKSIEAEYMKPADKIPEIHVGDTVRVGVRIQEGGKREDTTL